MARRRYRVLKIALPLLTLVCAVLAVGYLRATKPQIERTGFEERARPIAAATVRIADVQPSISAYGEVVAQRDVELPCAGGGSCRRGGRELRERRHGSGWRSSGGDRPVRVSRCGDRGGSVVGGGAGAAGGDGGRARGPRRRAWSRSGRSLSLRSGSLSAAGTCWPRGLGPRSRLTMPWFVAASVRGLWRRRRAGRRVFVRGWRVRMR